VSVTSLDWQEHAACKTADPDLFFSPDPGPDTDLIVFAAAEDARVKAAGAVCRTCPVTAECAAYAVATGQRAGIWAGRDFGQRLCGRRLHVMTEANTQARSDGTHCCRACRNAADKRYRLRLQEREVAA
jgi:WhiB family transcriptional regulator, redox-sensing transcriptional regulator